MLYARKINTTAWFLGSSLDSDAVSELRTSNHELSVWTIDESKQDIDDIALALALTLDKIDEMYIVFLNVNDITNKYKWEIQTSPQPGKTQYVAMQNRHINFVVPTFWEQGYLTEYIQELVNDKNNTDGNLNYVYYDVPTLKELLYEAVKTGKITKADLNNVGRWKKSLSQEEAVRGIL